MPKKPKPDVSADDLRRMEDARRSEAMRVRAMKRKPKPGKGGKGH